MLTELGKGNFSVRAQLDSSDDMVNTILAGLNMLGEELLFYKEQLDAKSQLLQDTVRNIGEVVYSVRLPHGAEPLGYDFVSPRIRGLLGYTEEQVMADAGIWRTSIHPDDRATFDAALARLKNGEEVICEYRITRSDDNEYLWLEDCMWPRADRNGSITVAFGCARDVTRQKAEAAERDKLTRELSNKLNELMQFNYIVSHNLRSPVATILAACDLLDMELDDAEKTEARNCILMAAQNMDLLLRDLNVILSAKSMINEKFESFSMPEMVHNILQALNQEVTNARAIVYTDITPRAEFVNTIKGYLQSCLYNLINNAIKYRHPSRPLELSIKIWREYQAVYFEVSDNGIGIDLERHRDKIFGLYQRFNDDVEGKGLGLHMTRVQVEALGGTISVKSQPGKGSTFTFTIRQ